MHNDVIPVAKPLIGAEERAAVDRVLASGQLAGGPEVARFEQEFAEQVVAGRECVAVNSGTSGLHLGLLAAGVGPGDEIIVPAFTFAASANAIALTGAKPVFVDIEPATFNLDPDAVRAAIGPRTRGVMAVHLFGQPADLTRLGTLADQHGIELFEDAAQAHLATWRGRQVGSFGRFSMFSLYPTKNMTSGEGGMVACEDAALARALRLLRNQGMEKQYANEVIGFNNRMTDLHAAIGRTQLRKVAAWTEQRQANARFLDEHLHGVVVPPIANDATHVYHQYTVRVRDARDEMARRLREEFGVGSGVYYPTPLHRLDSLRDFAPTDELTETERAAREVLSLPVHPSLSSVDLERIVTAVNAVMESGT